MNEEGVQMQSVQERFQVSPFFVFFLIHSMQVGVGILGFQRIVALKAGHDAWLGVLIAGLSTHLAIYMIYKTLELGGNDLMSVHRFVFGRWLGGFLSCLFLVYLLFSSFTVLRTYIEIVQVWMFQDFSPLLFSFLFLVLVFYIVSGGFRTVAGICFFGVVLPFYLLLTFFFPLEFSNIRNLLPTLDSPLAEIISSAKGMTLSILGFEILFIYYPFLKNPKKSKKWAHYGLLLTTLLYLLVLAVSLSYFSEIQLQKNIWPTLTMWKIVELPFVERFEYIGIANWCLVILPNICLPIWAASRGVKILLGIRQKKALYFILALVFILTAIFNTRGSINMLNNYVSKFGFYFIFGYIPLLFLATIIASKARKLRA